MWSRQLLGILQSLLLFDYTNRPIRRRKMKKISSSLSRDVNWVRCLREPLLPPPPPSESISFALVCRWPVVCLEQTFAHRAFRLVGVLKMMHHLTATEHHRHHHHTLSTTCTHARWRNNVRYVRLPLFDRQHTDTHLAEIVSR